MDDDVVSESVKGGGLIEEYNTDDSLAYPLYLTSILTSIYSAIFLIGVFGNLFVIMIMVKDKKLRTLTNFYFVSLSVADLMIITFCLPISIYELFYPNEWLLGSIVCKLTPFLQYLSVNASMLTILAIAVERFIVICRPLKAKVYCTKRNILTTALGIWLICCLASLPSLFFSDIVEDTPTESNVTSIQCYMQTAGHDSYRLFQIVLFYVLPGVFLSAICYLISRSLSKRKSKEIFMSLPSTVMNRRTESRRQLNLMLIVVVVAYFVCLLPFNLILVISVIAPSVFLSFDSLQLDILMSIVRVLFFINSCVNPILYNVVSSNFRAAFSRICCCFCPRQRPDTDDELGDYCTVDSPRTPRQSIIVRKSFSFRSTNL